MEEMKKGDLYYANLGSSKKTHIQTGIRPIVILQNNIGNIYSDTIIVAPITSKIKKLQQPTHIELLKDTTNGLENDSIVLLEQIMTIDKNKLLHKIGVISQKDLHNINNGLIASFDLKENLE